MQNTDLEGLNAVFINMPLRETAIPNTTPAGPLILATILRQFGVDATIIDLNAYRIKDDLAQRRGLPNGRHLTQQEANNLVYEHFRTYGEPDLVGLSGLITTLGWQEKIAATVRRLAPDTHLVSGGGLATALKSGLFNYIPKFDAIAISECDDVIVKIAYDAKTIKESGFKNALGRHRFIYQGARPRDLDAVPFADLELLRADVFGNPLLRQYLNTPCWSKTVSNSSAIPWNDEDVVPKTTFVSSRGCPHACAFCCRETMGGKHYDIRSAENIAAEFALHKEKYGIKFVGMNDDNFGINYRRTVELSPLLKELGVRWGTHMRLDEAVGFRENPKQVDLMAKAGCIYIGFGAESASPKILDFMKKGGFTLKYGLTNIKTDGKTHQVPRAYVDGIKNCENAGIHSSLTWIMGYLGETLEDLKTSVAFIKWLEEFYVSQGKPADSVNKKMFTATAYPGAEMFYHPKVIRALHKVFGINFDSQTGLPVCDENFRRYLLELDDATKVLYNHQTGEPLNFSDMPEHVFLKAREYIDTGEIYKILEM